MWLEPGKSQSRSATDRTAALETALIELYRDHYRQMVGYLVFRRNISAADAEDLIAEACLAAYQTSSGYDPLRGSLKTWLYTVALHKATDLLRTRRRRPTAPADNI